MNQDFSCGVIPLKYDGTQWSFFLVKNANGPFWGFPKGHPDKGESHFQAAARELKEETDLDVLMWLDAPAFEEHYTFQKNDTSIHKTVHYYLARVSVEFQIDCVEIIDGGWYDFQQAYELLTFPEGKEVLNQVMLWLQKSKPEIVK